VSLLLLLTRFVLAFWRLSTVYASHQVLQSFREHGENCCAYHHSQHI